MDLCPIKSALFSNELMLQSSKDNNCITKQLSEADGAWIHIQIKHHLDDYAVVCIHHHAKYRILYLIKWFSQIQTTEAYLKFS